MSIRARKRLCIRSTFSAEPEVGTVDLDMQGNEVTNVGSLEIKHTAIEDNDNAVALHHDAAGFTNASAMEINHTTGAIAAGREEQAVLISIDDTASTGGEVYGTCVLTTEGAADVIGLKVGAEADVLIQIAGTFGAPGYTDNNGGGALVVGSNTLWVAQNDTFTFGSPSVFEEVEFLLTTGASGSGIDAKYEYSTGVATWTTFGPTDSTNNFKNTGVLAWTTADTPGWAIEDGTNYKIRITRERKSLATTPTLLDTGVKIAATTRYDWDKNGDLEVKSVTAESMTTDTIDEKTTSAGVTIEGVELKDNNVTTSGQILSTQSVATTPVFYSSGAASDVRSFVSNNANATDGKRAYTFTNNAGNSCLFLQALDNDANTITRNLIAFCHDGDLRVLSDIDTIGATASDILDLGTTRAKKVQLGRTGEVVNALGLIQATENIRTFSSLDTTTAVPLLIGPTIATKVEIADTGITTEVQGDLDVLGNIEVDGTQVVTNQQAAVADATDAASAITQLNALLARARTHGLIAT